MTATKKLGYNVLYKFSSYVLSLTSKAGLAYVYFAAGSNKCWFLAFLFLFGHIFLLVLANKTANRFFGVIITFPRHVTNTCVNGVTNWDNFYEVIDAVQHCILRATGHKKRKLVATFFPKILSKHWRESLYQVFFKIFVLPQSLAFMLKKERIVSLK